MPTFEQLQALGAVPVDVPPAAGGAKTLEELQAAGAKPIEPGTPAGPEVKSREAFVRGGLQGASLGFGDEAAALADTGVAKLAGLGDKALGLFGVEPHFGRGMQRIAEAGGGAGPGLPLDQPDLTYQQRRDAYRARNEAASAQHPGAYLGGELVGGLAAVPFAEAGEAKTLAKAVKAGAKLGAKVGGVTGLGTSKADLTEGDVTGALLDTAKGAALGGLVGGATAVGGEAAKRVLTGGRQRIRDWVQKDIIGDARGASTATAKKNLARDAEDIADVVTRDRPLETVLRKASHQDKEHLTSALETVRDRLDTATAPRSDLYKGLDEVTGGGVKAGDFVAHIEDAIKARVKTGLGDDAAQASELRSALSRIKGAEDWGFKSSLKPEEEQIVKNLEAGRTRALSTGKDPAQYDDAIEKIQATASPSFDPNHVVPTEKLRDFVTDMQNTAFRNEGGINGTERFRRASEVARVPAEFLDSVKEQAREWAPKLVEKLDEHDKTVSALLRVKNVLEQRFNRAEQDAMGATGHGLFGRALHAAAHPKATLTREAVAAGARGVIATGRAIDRTARAIEEHPHLSMVLDGLRRGLTLAASVEAARTAADAAGD